MKKLIPLLLILACPAASAAEKLPPTAKLLFQVTGVSLGMPHSEEAALQQATDYARQRIQSQINGSDGNADPINVEYQCQTLYRVWSLADTNSSDSSQGFFLRGTGSYLASVTVNVYCDPRDFPQKVAISAMQACEKEPKEACMSKDYMDAFAKIKKTSYYDIYSKR